MPNTTPYLTAQGWVCPSLFSGVSVILSQVERSASEVLASLPKRTLRSFVPGGNYVAGADHTATLTAAAAAQVAARNAGNPFAIYAEALQWRFQYGSGVRLDWGGPLVGEGYNATEFLNIDNTRAGGGTIGGCFRWSGATTLAIIKDFTIRGANIPPVANMNNSAPETDAAINTDFAGNVLIEGVWVRDYYGVGILVRRANKGVVRNNRLRGIEKDGISISHGCQDIVVEGNEVYYGGDDLYSVLGPVGLVRPTRIYHIGNRGYGAKFARGMVYAGAENCYNSGHATDGRIPQFIDDVATSYPLTNGTFRFLTTAGLMMLRDGSSGTQGCENMTVRDMRINYCGFDSEFTAGVFSSVLVQGTLGFPNKNIDIEAHVYGGRKVGFSVIGGTTDNLANQNVKFKGSVMFNTDPLGLAGTAGAGTSPAVQVEYCTGLDVQAYVEECGRQALNNTSASLDGKVVVDLRTRKVNKAGTAGVDIISAVTGQPSTDIALSLRVLEQLQNTTSGTAYYLDNLIEWPGVTGKITKFEMESQNLTQGLTLGYTPISVTVTGSPFTWLNNTGVPVSMDIQGGTLTLIEQDASGSFVQQFTSLNVAAVRGNFIIPAGTSIRITYSVAPTTFRYRPFAF
jgi:hypothetical protein